MAWNRERECRSSVVLYVELLWNLFKLSISYCLDGEIVISMYRDQFQDYNMKSHRI